jgi:hypothetical protein
VRKTGLTKFPDINYEGKIKQKVKLFPLQAVPTYKVVRCQESHIVHNGPYQSHCVVGHPMVLQAY